MSRLRFAVLPLLLLVVGSASAQAPNAEKLAAITKSLQGFVESNDLSGAVAVVGRKDGTIYHEAVGLSNIEARTPMAKDTVFRIASMTKPITAIAIMILSDEGKLSVEDPVEKYIPEFQGQMLATGKGSDAALKKPARPITLRDLLTHTSGLPGNYPKEFADVYQKRNRTLEETTKAIAKEPLQFEPGTKWAYCNSGIDTLGRIVEVVSGERFEEFLQKRVFTPLGMTDTSFYPTPDQLKRLAIIYNKKDDKLVAAPSPLLLEAPAGSKHPVPAGGLYSTGADIAKLYRLMLHKGQLDGKRILSEAAVAMMTKTQTGDIETGFVPGMSFGFGWAVVKQPKDVTGMLSAGTYGHGGAFGTQGWIDPKQDLFVILLIQRNGLSNGDASPMRKALQDAAVAAIR